MARRIVLRSAVPDDIAEIVQFLETKSAAAADRFVEAVFAAIDDLNEMPGKGSPKRLRIPSLKNLRSWWVPGFRKYLIFYHFDDNALTILAVLHGSRNIRKFLRGRAIP